MASSWSTARSFKQTISPFSWMLIGLAMVSIIIVVFDPKAIELSVLIGFDQLIANPLILAVDARLFQALYPESRLYFSRLDEQKIGAMTQDQRLSLLESLVTFPRHRSLYGFAMSAVYKLPLATAIMVLYWQHNLPEIHQFYRTVAMLLFTYVFFAILTFFESHELVSKVIADIHARFDWSATFSAYEIHKLSPKQSIRYETAGVIAMGAMMLGFQFVVARTYQPTAAIPLSVQLVLIGFYGMLMLARVVYVSRNYHIAGLQQLFDRFQSTRAANLRETLPLHSSPMLARFEKTFNELIHRLIASERELSALVLKEAERYRFQSLGEISAMVSHDLAAPLSVIQFCAETAQKNPEKLLQPRYQEQLFRNANYAVELVETLRAYLRNPGDRIRHTYFREAHDHVIRLLAFQATQTSLNWIRLTATDELLTTDLDMPRSDLIHVLYNLYNNALTNLRENKVQDPLLSVVLVTSAEALAVRITDNGTGLSLERYEELTSYRFVASAEPRSEGLGLRLCRRVVEQYGGDLSVLPSPDLDRGTTFLLKIKMRSDARPLRSTAE